MALLRKLPNKFQNLLATTRLLSTAAISHRHPFPDRPTCAYYDDVINEAAKSEDFETVRHFLNKRIRDGFFNTNNTFKFIINTESSLSLLPGLSQTLARLDPGLPRKNAFDSLIARLCKLKRVEESLKLIEAMATLGVELNAVSFYPILSLLCRSKKTDDAWRVMELMKVAGVNPDVTAYNFLLTRHCFDGDLTATAKVLEKMQEENIVEDSRSYDALVLGACRAGKVDAAVALIRRMDDDGLPALYSTYMHVIGSLFDMNCCEQAIKFVRSCGGKDLRLDTDIFGVLASRLIDKNKDHEAMEVLEEMKKKGLQMGQKLKDFMAFNE